MCNGMGCKFESGRGECKKKYSKYEDRCPHEIEADKEPEEIKEDESRN